MARHGENIRKRKDGRWEGRYIKGKDAGGKPHWGYLYGRDYAQVKQALIQKKAESSYYLLNGRDPTFSMLACHWLRSMEQGVKPSTAAHYRYTLERYLLPVLGRYRVSELDEDTLEQGLLAVFRPEDGSHRPLGAAMARECLVLTRRICKYGAHLRYMRPVEIVVRLPRPIPRATQPLNQKEQTRLEASILARPTARGLGLLLCMQLGLRIGEVCGLQWRDIDLKAGVLSVRRTVQRICCGGGKTRVILQSPKTPSSRREIPLPRPLLESLNALAKTQGGSGWFLSGRAEKPVEPRSYRKSIKALLKKAKVRLVHPHMLRHTFATFCVQKGCDLKTLSELMGHADASITLRKYVHTTLERKRKELNRIYPAMRVKAVQLE